MATLRMQGLKEYEEMLSKLDKDTVPMIGRALYEGGKIVADEFRREVEALLRDMGFEPKNVMRQNNLITYFKSSTHIEDLLTLIGAPGRALEIMSAKIEKEMRNTVNRRVNCDAANLDKAVLASREQVEAFTRLTESGAINDLPVKLQEVAVARLLQPELTLSELAATFDPPLTKSCLNHRIRKLMEIAKKEENE